MTTQPAVSNSPERKGGQLYKGNTGCVDPQGTLLSSLTLVEQDIKKSFPSRKRERRERGSFHKSVFSRKCLLLFSWIPLPSLPSLLEYQLPLLSPYYWTKAPYLIPLLFAQAVSVVSNIVLIPLIQGAKKVIFTACQSGKLKLLAFTSPNVISTSPQNFLMSRIDFTLLL